MPGPDPLPSYQDLLKQKGAFATCLAEYAEEKDDKKDQSDSKKREDPQIGASEEKGTARDEEKSPFKGGSTLIEKEHAETGSMKFDVFLYYLRAVGIAGCVAAIFGVNIYSASKIMENQWLTWWTSNTFGNAGNERYYAQRRCLVWLCYFKK